MLFDNCGNSKDVFSIIRTHTALAPLHNTQPRIYILDSTDKAHTHTHKKRKKRRHCFLIWLRIGFRRNFLLCISSLGRTVQRYTNFFGTKSNLDEIPGPQVGTTLHMHTRVFSSSNSFYSITMIT